MKTRRIKLFLVFAFVLALFAAVFCACAQSGEGGGDEPQAQYYTVEYTAGTGGSISGETTQRVEKGGDTQSVRAVPDSGYQFVGWSDGLKENARTDENISADAVLTARFERNLFVLQYRAGAGGTIEGVTQQKVYLGRDGQTVQAVPSEGYEFVLWSDGYTQSSRTDENISSDKIVTAYFRRTPHNVVYLAEEGGSIRGEAIQSVAPGGSTQTVTAVADEGYEFVGWSDGLTTPERTDENVGSDIIVTARFQLKVLTVLYLIYPTEEGYIGGYISGYGYQCVTYGQTSAAVRAVAFEGFEFVGWSDGVKSAERSDVVKGDITVAAHFKTAFSGGLGTQTDPYIITSYDQLKNMSAFPEAHFVLGADIDAGNYEHQLLFGADNAFVGTFDGAGHIISGITITQSVLYPSLFGVIGQGAEVTNVTLADVLIDIPSNVGVLAAGTLAGSAQGCTIENVSVTGAIRAENCYAGGLICWCNALGGDLTISGCNVDVDIEAYAGAGFITDIGVSQGETAVISSSVYSGRVQADMVGGFIRNINVLSGGALELSDCEVNSYSSVVGGVMAAGFVYSSEGSVVISDCSVGGMIVADDHSSVVISGFICVAKGASLKNCRFDGTVLSSGVRSITVAAFGHRLDDCSLEGCSTTCTVGEGARSSAMFAITLNDSTVSNCYSDVTVADPAEDTFVFVNVYSSEIERFYYVGNSTGYFIRTVSDSSLSNCHVLRPEGSGELVSEDRGQTPSPLDIAVYSRESDMYDLADKLNGGLENPAWVNVENSTPQLIED